MTPAPRRAGQHACERTRLLAVRGLVALILIVTAGVTVGVVAGFTSFVFVVTEVAAIGAVLLLDRVALPIIDRWDRGAELCAHVIEPPRGAATALAAPAPIARADASPAAPAPIARTDTIADAVPRPVARADASADAAPPPIPAAQAMPVAPPVPIQTVDSTHHENAMNLTRTQLHDRAVQFIGASLGATLAPASGNGWNLLAPGHGRVKVNARSRVSKHLNWFHVRNVDRHAFDYLALVEFEPDGSVGGAWGMTWAQTADFAHSAVPDARGGRITKLGVRRGLEAPR